MSWFFPIADNVLATYEPAKGRFSAEAEWPQPQADVLWAGAVLEIRSQIRGAPAGFGFGFSRLGEWVGAARGSRRFRTCV